MSSTKSETQELSTSHRAAPATGASTSCSRWRCTSPATSTGTSWPAPARSVWSRRPAATTSPGACRSTGSPPSASAARSSTPCGPPTGRPARCAPWPASSRRSSSAWPPSSVGCRSRDEMAEALGMTRDELSRLQDRMFRSVVLALEHEVSDADEDLTLVDVLCRPQRRRAARGARDPRAARLPA